VALARAIVSRPRVLLMDEPLSNLDLPLRDALVSEIRRIQRELGLTVLYVTHNRDEVFALGDRVAVIHSGRVEQVGRPRDLYEQPTSEFIATFLGRCTLIRGRVAAGEIHCALGAMPFATPPSSSGSEVLVVIRPEDVHVDGTGPFAGRIKRAVFARGLFEVQIAGSGWSVLADLSSEPALNTDIRFSIRRFVTVPPQGSA
jgi:ABC-type sugar transport system ATPase subunit